MGKSKRIGQLRRLIEAAAGEPIPARWRMTAVLAPPSNALFGNVRFALNRYRPRCRWCGGDTRVEHVEVVESESRDEVRIRFYCHGEMTWTQLEGRALRAMMKGGETAAFVGALTAPVFESSIGACETCSLPITTPCACRRICPWDGPDEDA